MSINGGISYIHKMEHNLAIESSDAVITNELQNNYMLS